MTTVNSTGITFSDNTVQTTAGAVTLEVNGSIQLPNGMIEKWGTYGPTTVDNGSSSITFSEQFPNALLNLQLSEEWVSGAGGPEIIAQSKNLSKTGFTILWGRVSGSGTDVINIHWRAIGY